MNTKVYKFFILQILYNFPIPLPLASILTTMCTKSEGVKLTFELQWTCCCPPINEKTLTWPSQDELAMTAGFLGHHATSKLHWLPVGSSHSTYLETSELWVKCFPFMNSNTTKHNTGSGFSRPGNKQF